MSVTTSDDKDNDKTDAGGIASALKRRFDAIKVSSSSSSEDYDDDFNENWEDVKIIKAINSYINIIINSERFKQDKSQLNNIENAKRLLKKSQTTKSLNLLKQTAQYYFKYNEIDPSPLSTFQLAKLIDDSVSFVDLVEHLAMTDNLSVAREYLMEAIRLRPTYRVYVRLLENVNDLIEYKESEV